jgi:hypothetical protein
MQSDSEKTFGYSKYVWSSMVFTWAIMLIWFFISKVIDLGLEHASAWVLLAAVLVLLYLVREMLWVMWSPLGDTSSWRVLVSEEKEDQKKTVPFRLDWRAEMRIASVATDAHFDVRLYCRNMVKDINQMRDVTLGLYA